MKVSLKSRHSKYNDLTPGNTYRVIGIEADDLRIMNDDGLPYLYPPQIFKITDPRKPKDWLTSFGEKGERYSYPRPLNRPGFFEDYFDDDAPTIAALRAYLAQSHKKAPDLPKNAHKHPRRAVA